MARATFAPGRRQVSRQVSRQAGLNDNNNDNNNNNNNFRACLAPAWRQLRARTVLRYTGSRGATEENWHSDIDNNNDNNNNA